MARLLAPLTLLLLLVTAACAKAPAAAPNTGANVVNVPAGQASTSANVSWTRPMNVAPLTGDVAVTDSAGGKLPAGQGNFDVISNDPWPGEKVRVFFFGVQG